MKFIILAGGKGTRLWPISRESFPKQFLKLGSELSFLQKTLQRFLKVASCKDILIVTNEDHFHLVKSQAAQIGPFLDEQIVIESERKNTGTATILGVKALQLKDEECFFVSPSDHLIFPEDLFLNTLPLAEKMAKEGKVVTFGIPPHKPETGYGYIKAKDMTVEAFVERPSQELAQTYLLEGGYFWNSGMFVFQTKTFWEEVNMHAPFLLSKHPPNISLDFAIMEKTRRLVMIPLEVTWSDIGSWDTVFDVLKKDHNQNVKIGNIHDIDTKNCLLVGDKRLISTVGIEDIIVIETEDALFLGKKGESQRVKAVVEELSKKEKKETVYHSTMHRPWGQYTVLEEGPRYKVKRILVDPLQKLSLQLHYHRSEHWVVVQGTAVVTVGDKTQLLHENESVYVPKSTLHRLENPGKVPLEIIEVQVGEYVGEDDIVRYEDIYNRK